MANGDRRLLRTRLDKQRRVLRRRFALFKTLLVHMRLLAGLTEIEKKSDDGVNVAHERCVTQRVLDTGWVEIVKQEVERNVTDG
jgi:hypothetical protein